MLTDLQKEKMTHYFNVLDFDNNGKIEKDDFQAIGENLNILWGYKEGTDKYARIMDKFGDSWEHFRDRVDYDEFDTATLEEWLSFADQHIINGSEEFFDTYVRDITRDIFNNFDNNGDGFISLDEYIDFFMAYRIEIRYSAKSYTKLDLNSDDLLSRQEMLSAVDQFFRSDDKDAPGNWLFGFWGAK
jgi:Ca2+-binding EF-hand superfamily protein